MARGRAKLTEKEERIMIQAQLTGLTTANMIKIANRMKALEKEKEHIDDVALVSADFTWTQNPGGKRGWKIVDKNGKHYEFHWIKREHHWSSTYSTYWDLKISKPNTRFKDREVKKLDIYMNDDIPNRLCPENSKELYAILKAIKRGNYEHV